MAETTTLSITVSPPQLARRYGVKPSRVIAWIRAGELAAINIGGGGRPRYRITPEAIREFEAVRSTGPRRTRHRSTHHNSVEQIF